MKKETYYFSHDYNCRTDPNIKKLLVAHGLCGYGLWWCIIEDLYNNNNTLPLHYESIAYELHCESSFVKSVINDFGLFELTAHTFSSQSVGRRLAERAEKSIKAKESVAKRWNNKKPEKQPKEKKQFTPPSINEVQQYFYENGYPRELAQKAHSYYTANDWKDSRGKQVLNWKQKMQGNWFRPENKTSNSHSSGFVI